MCDSLHLVLVPDDGKYVESTVSRLHEYGPHVCHSRVCEEGVADLCVVYVGDTE